MTRAPALFLGHGSPRDAHHETEATLGWIDAARRSPRPRAILCISAHWECKGVLVTRNPVQRTIHDFYRMPQELYDIEYAPPGDPELAYEIEAMLDAYRARADLDSWGLDHGAWAVLRFMYPQADVPTLQLSLDVRRSPAEHFAIARALRPLRDKGVMIVGSGNIVHNLRVERPRGAFVYPWAQTFDDAVVERLEAGDHAALVDWHQLPGAADAVPEDEHYLPLLYVLGAAHEDETPRIFNRAIQGSVSMTCAAFGQD
jgi:4,5-DOPA dioxygenase extradiol